MINISGFSSSIWNESEIRNSDKHIMVIGCGYQKFVTRDYSISRDSGRADFQLIYIINGNGWFTFKNERIEISTGNVIIYKPNEPQFYSYYYKQKPELYWIHFTGSIIPETLKKLSLWQSSAFFVGKNAECMELFKKIMFELNTRKLSFEFYTSAYLLELLSCFSRLASANKDDTLSMFDDINKVIMQMHSTYNKNCEINVFAKECNLSKSRFSHKFKSYTGKTPTQYLTQIRINEAKYHLSYSSQTISEISFIVGYENPLYFSRIFKKETGMSPRNFRKSLFPYEKTELSDLNVNADDKIK
jgi:AraC-like DNA-binding protein